MLNFLARAWKLFQRAIIFFGTHGISTVTSASENVSPLAEGEANSSPSCTVMVSPSSVPKPLFPPCSKRIQRGMPLPSEWAG